jgi:hypothetical protein
MKVADKTYYLNQDRSKAIPAGSAKEGEDDTPDGAAFLLVRAGGEVTAEMEEKYGVKGKEQEEAKAEPGIVTSAAEGNEQGFVAASAAKEAGMVVTEGQDTSEGDSAPAKAVSSDSPKATKTAGKASKKAGK